MALRCAVSTTEAEGPSSSPAGSEDEAGAALGDGAVSGGRVAALIADGLIDGAAALGGRVILTLRGRLLADYVTRELMGY